MTDDASTKWLDIKMVSSDLLCMYDPSSVPQTPHVSNCDEHIIQKNISKSSITGIQEARELQTETVADLFVITIIISPSTTGEVLCFTSDSFDFFSEHRVVYRQKCLTKFIPNNVFMSPFDGPDSILVCSFIDFFRRSNKTPVKGQSASTQILVWQSL